MNNFDTYHNVERRINTLISQAVSNLPKSMPCKVAEVKGNVVKVQRMLLNNNIIGFVDNVPIVRSVYGGYPVQVGDLGILFTCDYPVSSYVENSNLPASEMKLNSNGAGYLFLPLAPIDKDLVKDNNAYEFYSIDGTTSFIIDNDKVVIKDSDNNEILIDSNGIKLLDTNNNTIELTSNGIKINDSNNNVMEFTSSGAVITDSNNNNIELGSSGITITDSNNNTVALSGASVKINNNLEVLQ